MIKSNTTKHILSHGLDDYFIGIYKGYQFTLRFFKEAFVAPFHVREIINQCFEVGFKSLSLITLVGFIVGIVFTKQSRPPLEDFGATSWLPPLIGIAIVKALGPLITAIIGAGKVGSSIGAELGSMKVTEQIEAMEVSAINPYKYLVVSRVIATTITIPVLSLYCSFVGLLGSYFNIRSKEETSVITFFENAFSNISFIELYSSVTKAIVYGFTIGIVGCYKGFNATQGTRGVGRAANQAVVLAMFLIFLEEIVIVQVANWILHY
jgi:phospholipid/cholesterol/gamma-HCH transport system permease protein